MVLPPESFNGELVKGQVGWVAPGTRLHSGPNSEGEQLETINHVPLMDKKEPAAGWLQMLVDLGRGPETWYIPTPAKAE